MSLISKLWSALKSWRINLRAQVSKYLVTRQVTRVLELTHAIELAGTPKNEWALVRQRQIEEIKAVQSGQQFDIVDRRSWAYPYLPEALHRLNQPVLKNTPYNLRRFCFSADTEVLTKRGWVLWPSITLEDTLATYNIPTGKAEWQKPSKIFKYEYTGEMYLYENKHVDILVTPDHKMLGRFRKSSNLWDGRKDCPECGKELSTVQAMGSHRRKIHGIKGGATKVHEKESYSYSKVGLVRANKVEKFQNKYKSGVYAFELPMTAKWEGKFPKDYNAKDGTIQIGKHRVDLLSWVKFLGIFVAEGSCRGTLFNMDLGPNSKKPHYVQAMYAAADTSVHEAYEQYTDNLGRNPYEVRITQTINTDHNREIHNQIYYLLKTLPWKFDEENDFSICDKDLHKYLFRLGNSYTKRVPKFIKRLPPSYIQEFIKWACMGDGTAGSDRRTYFTVSKELASDIQELFQISGMWAQVHKIKQRGSKAFGIEADRQAPLYAVSEHISQWGGLPDPEHVEYSGNVYCAAVANRTVYVRRNGKPCWSGRSETPIPRRAMNLVKNAVLSFKWQIKPTKEYADDDDPDRAKRIKIATETLKRPNNAGESFRDWLEQMIEDFLLNGAGCSEHRATPYAKRPTKFWAVDSSTIRIFLDWTESTPDRPRYAQMTGLKGERGIVTFLTDELMYIRDNIRTATPFGLGRLEVAFNSVNAFLGVQDMSARAGADQVHKTWLWWQQTLNTAHVQQIRRHVQNELEGQAKLSLIAGVAKPDVVEVTPVTPDDLLLDWQKFLIQIIAAAFDLSPQALNMDDHPAKATAQVMADSDWKSAVVPVATRFQTAITRQWLHDDLGWKDLEFEFSNLDDPDLITRTVIDQRLYQMNAITPNQIATKNNLPLIPGPWGKLTMGQLQLITMQAQAQVMGKVSGSPGGGSSSGGSSQGGMSSGSTGGSGSLGTGIGTNSSMGFSADDVTQMSPDEISLYQELGILPETQQLGQQMDQQSPGILDQLSDELTEFFNKEKTDKLSTEVQPDPVTSVDEAAQLERFYEDQHQESLAEKVINRRGTFGPAINQQVRKNPVRGKYPRSGSGFVDTMGKDRASNQPLKTGKPKKNYRPGKNNPYGQ